MNTTRISTRRLPAGKLIAVVCTIAALVLLWLIGDQFVSGLVTALRTIAFIIIPVVVVAAFALLVLSGRGGIRVLGFALVGLAIVATLAFWVTHSYTVDKTMISSVKVVDDPAPGFALRAAQPVAVASSKSNLGNTTGTLLDTRFVVDGSTDTWNALVERKATFGGYESLQVQHLGTTSATSAPAATCAFNIKVADRKLEGIFNHSLERAIYHQARYDTMDTTDAYGVCLDGKPSVIVPLKKRVGWLYSHETAAGVAIYDGTTGTVTVKTDVKSGELPGPVYPLSLAKRTREAAAALGSFSDYFHNRSGYEDTTDDEGDPNGDNRSEFSLRNLTGGGDYATPLTPQGSSTQIIALGVVDANSNTAGMLNTFEVHRYNPAHLANSQTAQKIRADYGDLNWASGLNIFEITPSAGGEYTASVGFAQQITHRIVIGVDGSTCLYRANGEKVRCVGTDGTNTDAPANNPGTTTGPATVPANNSELEKLSDEKLVALHDLVERVVIRRMTERKPR